MPLDFTLDTYQSLLNSMMDSGYLFQSYIEFVRNPMPKVIVLRHDVDAMNKQSLLFANMQHAIGIRGTYYFRVVRGSWDEEIMHKILIQGHEIGYHYEDMAICAKDHRKDEREIAQAAFLHFNNQLQRFREIAPVQTICAHGSPLSSIDNRALWKYYDYHDQGIEAEPYFDTDFTRVAYFTDTGRRWNGDRAVIRDRTNHPGALRFPRIRTTFDLIGAFRNNLLPDQLMLTFHPQRWHNSTWFWTRELILQNLKNSAKSGLRLLRHSA